jgi:hypothetical protein
MQHPNTSETIDLHANTNVGVHRVEARLFAGTDCKKHCAGYLSFVVELSAQKCSNHS